jgi:HEAT repeat protein
MHCGVRVAGGDIGGVVIDSKRDKTIKIMKTISIVIIPLLIYALFYGLSSETKANGLIKEARKTKDHEARQICEDKLVSMGKPAVSSLIDSLKDDKTGDENSFSAKRTLVRIGEPAVEPLITALHNRDQKIQGLAVETLGEIEDARAVDALIALLKDNNQDVRMNVIKVLGNSKDARVVDALIALLKDNNQDVRMNVIKVLGNSKDARAIDALVALLKDSNRIVSMTAKEALVNSKDAYTVKTMIALLKDDDELNRKDAMYIVKRSGDTAIQQLIVFLGNDTKYVYDHYKEIIAAGVKGTEPALIQALNSYDDKEMGLILLNTGNKELDNGAKQWGESQGYTVISSTDKIPGKTMWGALQ